MIRSASPVDAEVLADLIQEGFRDVAERFGLDRDNCPKHPSNCTPEWIHEDFQRGVRYFIMEENGTPVGCVGLEEAPDGACYVERLTVLPGCRGRGFGKDLLNHATMAARELDASRLEIGIISDDLRLKEWYKRRGFLITGTKRFSHLPFEVTFMARDI